MSPLYDSAGDVVAKALRGLGESPGGIAAQAGLGLRQMGDFLKGRFDPGTARRLAGPLGLDPEALARHGEPFARPDLPAGLERLELPFEDETVNCWRIPGDAADLVIDAGYEPGSLARKLPPGRPVEIIITHPHRDHIGGIDAVAGSLGSLRAPARLGGATVVAPGDRFEVAGRRVSVVDLGGHHPEAVGYRIDGFPVPVVAVGDALFARSAGGCPGKDAYRRARATIVQALAPLPPETVLLTGHGPPTTLAHERVANPFLAVWLSAGDAAPSGPG